MNISSQSTMGDVLAGVRLKTKLPLALAGLRVLGLDYDSRRICPGFLFFAFAGARADGRQFAAKAKELGAIATISELEMPDGFDGVWLEVEHGRRALAVASRNFYRHPDERVMMTGITGTNGKTTTSYLIDSILSTAGHTTALIGTIEYHLAGKVIEAANTTPESLDLFRILAELERVGGTRATMEVSSHALALGRAYGVRFHTAVFTNLTRDHLDFHHTMEEYFAAKQLLFAPADTPPPKFAVINSDDEYGRKIESISPTLRYGLDEDADVRATEISSTFDGLHFRLKTSEGDIAIASGLAGTINVYNILAACATGLSYGIDLQTIASGIANRPSVPGRFERVDAGQPFLVVVDYAHTDDALRNTLAVAHGMSPKRVITVFGCGGDRDRTKRPLMGKAAAEGSDYVVLTSDNPRSEDPLAIIMDALVGLQRRETAYVVEPDRKTAIGIALANAGPGDIVLIAGKGHENYQVLKDKTIHFDDREVARDVLTELGWSKL